MEKMDTYVIVQKGMMLWGSIDGPYNNDDSNDQKQQEKHCFNSIRILQVNNQFRTSVVGVEPVYTTAPGCGWMTPEQCTNRPWSTDSRVRPT